MLFSRSFTELQFMFSSIVYFELVFVKGMKYEYKFICFARGCPVVLVTFVRDYLCSIILVLLLCQRSVDFMRGSISGLCV